MDPKPPISVSEVDLISLETELGIERPSLNFTENPPPVEKKKDDFFTPINEDVPSDQKKEGEDVVDNEVNDNISVEDIDEDVIFSQLGESFAKDGILSVPEGVQDFKWTQETFIQQLEAEKQKGAQSLLEDLVSEIEGGTELFQSLFIDKVPITSFAQYSKSIVDYSTIDITTPGADLEKNQVKVVSSYLKSLDTDEEEIDAQIEYLKDTHKLDLVANKYKVKLVEALEKAKENDIQKSRTLEQQKIREKQQFVSDIASELKIAIKAKEIEGFPLTDKYAQELYVKITKPAYKLNSTGQDLTEIDKKLLDIRKDPKKYILLAHLIDNDLKIDKAVKKEASKQNSKIFNFIKTGNNNKTPQEDPMLDLLRGSKK